jgi:hypothetical protein
LLAKVHAIIRASASFIAISAQLVYDFPALSPE